MDITPRQFKRMFPNASQSTLKANSCDYGDGQPVCERKSISPKKLKELRDAANAARNRSTPMSLEKYTDNMIRHEPPKQIGGTDIFNLNVSPEYGPMVTLRNQLSITITGQIRGGKNNMIVTKDGKHIPRPEWKKWRDAAVAEARSQLPQNWEAISVPTNIVIEYVAGDRRRRDFPAICDAIFHVLERAGVVVDDTLLWPARSHRDYNKHKAMTRITFL